MKTWYLSKTLWVNIIAVIAFLVQSCFGFVIEPEAQAAILAVVNLVLRIFTGTSIQWNPADAGKLMALIAVCLALSACTTVNFSANLSEGTDHRPSIKTASDQTPTSTVSAAVPVSVGATPTATGNVTK